MMVTGSLYESDRTLYRFDLKSIFLNGSLEDCDQIFFCCEQKFGWMVVKIITFFVVGV